VLLVWGRAAKQKSIAAGTAKMPPVFSKPLNEPGFNAFQCWNDALYKLLTLPEHAPETRHRLMTGSLRFHGVGRYLWGGSDEVISENTADSHTWIEDEEGRVWDWLPASLNHARCPIIIPPEGLLINGLTKADITHRHRLYYEPAPEHICHKVFLYAFIEGIPWKPRTDRWVQTKDRPGYIFIRPLPRVFGVATTPKTKLAAQKKMGALLTSLNAERLYQGDTATLQAWRDFYADPFSNPDITAIIKIFHPVRETELCSNISLDDSIETEMLLKHGLIYPRFHALFTQHKEKLIMEHNQQELSLGGLTLEEAVGKIFQMMG